MCDDCGCVCDDGGYGYDGGYCDCDDGDDVDEYDWYCVFY